MNEQVPGGPPVGKAAGLETDLLSDDLLAMDRPGWAWEFLRRNPVFRDHLQSARPSKRRTHANVTTIEASVCAPEVRNFGICFR